MCKKSAEIRIHATEHAMTAPLFIPKSGFQIIIPGYLQKKNDWVTRVSGFGEPRLETLLKLELLID